jgi:hypothetical protein
VTAPPTRRALALDAVKQALNAGRYWLPPGGQEAAVDAVLALIADQPHVCTPGASVYYCPTAGEVESDCHGGFDTCCGQPERHLPLTGADPTVTDLQAAARGKGLRLEFVVEEAEAPAAGYCPHCGRGDAGPTADTRAALDLIRASIELRDAKAADEHEAGRHRSSNEHNAIAAGLRIAEAHILAALEPPKETPDA